MRKSTTLEKVILIVLILGIIVYFAYTYIRDNAGFIDGMIPAVTVEDFSIAVGDTKISDLTDKGIDVGYTDEVYTNTYVISKLEEEVTSNTHITNTLLDYNDKILGNIYIYNPSKHIANIKDTVVSYIEIDLKNINAMYEGKMLNDLKYDLNDEFFKDFVIYESNSVIKRIKANNEKYVVVLKYDTSTNEITEAIFAMYEHFMKSK